MIEQCSYCNMNSAGQHEWNCTANRQRYAVTIAPSYLELEEDIAHWKEMYEISDRTFWESLRELCEVLNIDRRSSFVFILRMVKDLVDQAKAYQAQIKELEDAIGYKKEKTTYTPAELREAIELVSKAENTDDLPPYVWARIAKILAAELEQQIR